MKSLMSFAKLFFAAVGLAATALIVGGIAADFSSFDRTQDGYDPPYTGWTGETIDWQTGDFTTAGFVRRGYIIDTLLDCTSGLITFDIFRQHIPFRKVSERAIIVHKPREACLERGFAPEF